MAKKDVDWFGRVTSVTTLLVSIVGLFAIVISYRSLKETETSGQVATASGRVSGYLQMVSQSADLDKIIIQHSALRPYFKDGKPLDPGGL
jgi:uncharacterized protein YdbL (DUF1318 family)